MSERWFRFYDGALDDPKVQSLRPELFKAWVNLLCVASRNKGNVSRNVSCKADVAFHLRCSETEAETIVLELINHGLIVRHNEWLRPHNWASRQYESDVSTQRVREFRERKRNVSGNVSETPDETPPEQSRTDTDIIDASASIVGDASDPGEPIKLDRRREEAARAKEALAAFGAAWNAAAAQLGLTQIDEIKTGSTRERHALARLRELGGDFAPLFARIRASPLLRGEKGGWRPDFNWIVTASNFEKVMEGSYEDRQAQRR